MTFTPDPQGGRGAWTRAGGLLPPPKKPDSKSGYYRAPINDEEPIGKAVVVYRAIDDAHMSVWQGARIIQLLLNDQLKIALVVDGWLGPKTDSQIRRFQDLHGLAQDGMLGPDSMKQMLTPLLMRTAANANVPLGILGGICGVESQFCPAAVGTNGYDHGFMAINLNAQKDLTWSQVMDPTFSFRWAAAKVRATYEYWVAEGTEADPWDIAIADHNSPRAARQWAQAGHPVPDPNRDFPIEDYVMKVRSAW